MVGDASRGDNACSPTVEERLESPRALISCFLGNFNSRRSAGSALVSEHLAGVLIEINSFLGQAVAPCWTGCWTSLLDGQIACISHTVAVGLMDRSR